MVGSEMSDLVAFDDVSDTIIAPKLLFETHIVE